MFGSIKVKEFPRFFSIFFLQFFILQFFFLQFGNDLLFLWLIAGNCHSKRENSIVINEEFD